MGCLMPQVGNRMLNPLFFQSLVQWYCAERILAAGTGPVDLSNSSRDGIFANMTVQPAIANGRPVFRFNGVNGEISYAFNSILTGTPGNFSCFAMVKNTTNVTARTMQCWANRTINNQCCAGNAANQLACFDNVNNPHSGVVDVFTNFTLIGVVCTAGSTEFFRNNISQGVGVGLLINMTLTTFGQVLTLVFSTMDVAELVFYTSALGATQRSVVAEFFRERYNF